MRRAGTGRTRRRGWPGRRSGADLVAPAARAAMAARVADRRTATRIVRNVPTVRHQSNDRPASKSGAVIGIDFRSETVIVRACSLSLIALSLIVSACILLPSALAAPMHDRAINAHPRFDEKGTASKSFTVEGDAVYGAFPDAHSEQAGRGVRFLSSADGAKGHLRSGSVRETVTNISATGGRWYRFRIRGLAQDGFHVQRDDLYLKVEFFRDGGTNSLDSIKKWIYPQVEKEREDFRDSQTTNPASAWERGKVTSWSSARRSPRSTRSS